MSDELINLALQQALLGNGVENQTEPIPETGNHPLSGLDFSQYAATSAMGAGRQSMSDREADLRSLGPNAYAQKYGVDALLDDYAQRAEAIGQRRFQEHQVTGRDALSHAADLGLSFGNAAASSITGLGTLGMGLIDDELGARGAQASDIISDAILGMQSKQMQAMRNIQQQDMDVRKRDNRSTSVNNLEMIGKDIVSTLQNYRGETVVDDVAGGFGSLVGLGMLRKGGAAVGNQLLKGRAERLAAARASGNLDEVARLQRQSQRMHTNAQTALIGASEAGGSYVDTVNQIMSMSHEQLMNSPEYRAIFEEVGNSTEAKQILANQAGQHSAMITAPIASALGRGVAAWETAPLRHSFTKGLATNIKNTALQGGEEFGQGLGGAYATGDAIQQYADATYNPAENMGEQAATGAVAGVGMSGSLNAPGTLVSGARAGITKASDIFSKRIKKAELNAEKGAGIDAETVNAVSTAAQQTQADFAASVEDAVATMAPEEQERGAAQFQKIYDLGTHTDGQYDNPTLNQVTEGSSNKFEAINRLADVAGDESAAPELRIQAAIALVQTANDVHDVINESPLIFENLADDHPAVVAANNIVDTVNATLQVKSVREAVTAAEQMIAEMEAPVVTEESFNTPEGRENVQTTIQLAEVAPDKVNVDSARVILAQAKQGTIELTPKQQRSLEYSAALLEAEANRLAIAPEDSVSIVSKEISLEKGEKGLPLRDHIKNIQRAEQAKDTAALETAVNALANFVEHMNNKVSALNKSAQDGKNHQYMAYNPKADKWFQTDGKGLFFNPNSEASLNLAATVQHEAAVATDVLNNVYELLGSNERVANVSINSPLVPKIEAVSPQIADPFGEVADPAPSRQAFTEKEEAQYDKSKKNALREKLESQRGLEKDTDLDEAAQNMDTKSIEKELNRLNRKGAKKLTEQDKLDQAALRKELKNRSDELMAPARAKKAVEEVAQEIRAEDAKKANAERVSETGQARTDAVEAVSFLNGKQLKTLQMQAMETMTQEEFDSFMKGEDIGLSIEELNAIKEMADSIRKAKVRPEPKKKEKAEEVKEEPSQQVQEDAPKAEAKPVTKAKKPDTTPADTKPKAEKKMPTTAERFPALARLGDIANNMFVRTFNLRGEDKNRLANEDSPVSFINSFLGSAGKITNLLGDVWGNKVTDHTVLDAWKDYMVTGDLLKEQVNKNLQTWLHAKKKSGSKFLDFSTQKPAFESADNVLIHLTEEGVDDKGNPTYNFNEKLLEGAVLAAMSWLINDALAANNRDIEDVAKTLGIHEHDVTPEVLAYYNEGVIKNFAIQDLGKKIQDFWGVSNKGDGYIGDQQGLTEGMARLLLDSMTQLDILKQEKQLVIPKTDGYGMHLLDAKGEPQTNPLPLKLVTQNALPAKEFNTQEEAEKVAEALQNTSSLLDELILTEPEKPIYVGKDAIPHRKSAQIRNSLAKLTYHQKQVQKRANSKNFHVDTNMAAIFGLLGSEGITEAFSTVTHNPDMYNVKDFKIIEAQNKAMASSFEELERILYEVKAVSEAEGTSIHDTPIRFGHEFSSVNRLQQQGRYTPQSSKLLREVILPTWADMDLSGNNEQHLTNFRMMLAQAFDIALHKNTWENANAELTEVLSKLDGAVELTDNLLAHVDGNDLLDQYPSSMNFAKRLREEFDKAGVELSPLTLHALVEYTRFTKATDDELKNFRTSLYLEADGMTNGPANAMIMYSGSEISADWIGNMESAGMYINQPEATAGLKNNQKDAGRVRDLYEKGAERLQRLLRANQKTLANSGVLKLFHIFENKSFSLGKEDNGLWDSQIGRNLIKNPLTVMLYGSGVSGVAGKLASNMLDSIYSEMTKALHRMHQNPELTVAQALFPSDSLGLSERRLAFFEEQLGKATSEHDGYQRRYKFRTAEDLKNFQITGAAFAQLTMNTFNDLAKPMHEAISETVGNKVMVNSEMIRNATNIMSIVAADLHKQLLDAEIEKNSKDKDYRKRQLITFDRARELERQASEMAAAMTSGTQNHLVQKVGEHEFKYDSHVAIVGAKSGSKGHTSTLGEAGVKGSAAMTISIDGQMVQNGIMTEKDIWQRQLEVFDGVNTPGDGIQDVGQQMNQAVWDSWNDNTMGMVADRFGTFLKNLNLKGLSVEAKLSISKIFDEKPKDLVAPYSDASLANLIQYLQEGLDKEGKAHAALMEVLSEMPITVDQMAGTYNPLVRNPDEEMQPRTPEELAEYIQQKVNDKLGHPKYQTDGGYAGMLEGAKYNKEGKVVQQDKLLSATELHEIAKTGLMNRAQKEIMFRALKSGFLKNWRVLTGDAKSLRKRAKTGMIDGKALEDMLSKGVEGYADLGYYSEGRRTLVLLNDSVETLVHETIHATTYDKFEAFYHNESKGLSKTDIEAIQRIEALMEQFMAEDVTDTLQHMPATMEKIQFVQKVVQDLLDQGNKAAAVNEFMSWTLGNDLLAERASRVKAPKIVQLARDVLKALKKLVFGDKAPYAGDDVLSNLVFNTAVLIQGQAPALETVIEDQVVLAQANSKNQSLTESVNNYITSNAELSPSQKKNIKDFTDAAGKLIHVAEAIRIAKAAFPSMTEGDLQTFGMVNSVLATENGFDSKAMREAAHVYDHVIANLKVSDFAGDKITAQAKFNAVVGRDLTGKDEFGRTAMLPTFVGLAMTVPEVSEILSKMDMPPRWKSREKGMDGVIENIGFLALENLGNRFTDPKKTPQVQAAMEVLGNEFVRNQTESQNVLMGTIGKAGSMLDVANQKLVDGMQALANVLYPEMTKEEQEKRTTLQKGMDIFGAGIASVISEPHAKIVAKGVTEQLDKTEGIPAFLRDLSNDLFGRNDSNKLLWDMVKHFRSKIQVVRQNYRADLPNVIRSKFKKPLSRKDWASLNTSMGKTDLGSLVLNGIDLKDAMTLAESSKERKARIKQLEGAFQHNTIEKAKQLAHFMNTGETGSYLLRNAEAIAKHTGHEGRVEAIAEIDHLVSLYALEGLSQSDQNTLSNLIKSEPEGMEFLMAYLSSQIAEERAKAVGTMGQFNYYKGNLPFEMKQDVSLRIADDAEGAKLISMGYKKLEAFKGSNLAPVRGKSYYYSPNSPTVAFSQGIVQNVRQTVSGVDMGTGHTLDTVVNRITKPHEVERITKNLHREKGLHLIPVFNEKGDVIAYEQRIDPNLQALVQDEADLASTIGKWRGRQVEEYLSKFSNDALVENLVKTYENDLKESKSNADRYVDLFESTDPVVVDALSLMPNDLRAQISEAMDGKFLVQRGMVKDVVGYRKATYTDSWTGVTRWSPEAQRVIKNAAVGIMGEKAFTRLREAQRIQENLVLNAKVIIAVKSVVVPAINILSNIAHLAARGVPLVDIAKGSKELTLEIEQYVKNRAKYLEIEADARVEQNPSRKLKLEKRLQNLEDANRRMQIWPLIEAGEFSSVSAADARLQDVQLTSGKLAEYIEGKVEEMPDSTKNLGRYAFISADTPLFEALQKSVEYGDFVAKAILYKDMTKRQGKSKAEALGAITEEFISYDHLPGRTRGVIEDLGMYWFGNFKLRSIKIAAHMIKNNPLHSIFGLMLPVPQVFGNTGIPLNDNLLHLLYEGKAGYSVGLTQGINSIGLNPWVNGFNTLTN